ncbi:MAG: type II toxin-antitoxin system prevent-host-death family antitoxin [Myxococcales bacterium]|nr:type II toxin-antitoxin system prevent-host-death family antitoxin [Myxococcales bacterium]
MKKVGAAKFKATCLSLMDRVAETGEPLEVTKRGKVLVRLVPVKAEKPRAIFGAARESILHLAPDEELLSTGAVWNADE